MANKCLAKPSRGLLQLAIPGVYEENKLRLSDSKHFRFYWIKKHFISEWFSLKTMRLGVLSWEWGKIVRLTTESRVWTNLGVEEQLLIFSSCLSPGQKASKLRKLASASKLATALIWNNQSHHEDGGPVTPVKVYKISTLWNANDLRQLVVVLTSGAFVREVSTFK